MNRFGVLKLLNNLKENKATGPDGIPGRLLKMCSNEITDVLCLIFQSSLNQGCIPSDWRKANIVPIYKKDDKHKVENYRPISLTSVTSKILEHIIHSSVMTFFEDQNTLNHRQHGFRKHRSCETQLITTLNDFTECLNNKKQTDAILLDFSKAFDKVDHSQLLRKLHKYGIRNNLLQWIKSFLSSREQTVLVDGKSSSPAPVSSGVPQGTVLGPLLFLVYINDINENITKGTEIRLFADDSLLYRVINSPLDQQILQNDLITLQAWEEENKMEFHPDKCKVLKITNKKKPLQFKYNIHNVILEEQDSAKYLGITIDKKLTWNVHCNSVIKKANSTLSFIQRNLSSCPPKIKEACYKTLVRPKLEYGCSVWDPHRKYQIDALERVQKRAARFVTSNYRLIEGSTHTNMTQLGWPPLAERRARIKLSLFFKATNNIIHIPTDTLTPTIITKTRNSGPGFIVPHSSVNSHLYSFFPNTIRLWNALPTSSKSSNISLESFQSSISLITIRTTY